MTTTIIGCIGSSLLVEKEEALIMSRIYRAKLNEKIREVNQPSAIDSFMAENSRILIRLISAATKYVAVEIKMLTSSLSDSISKSLANSGIQIPGFNSSYDSTAATDSSGNKSDSSKSTDNGSSSDSNSSSSTKK